MNAQRQRIVGLRLQFGLKMVESEYALGESASGLADGAQLFASAAAVSPHRGNVASESLPSHLIIQPVRAAKPVVWRP